MTEILMESPEGIVSKVRFSIDAKEHAAHGWKYLEGKPAPKPGEKPIDTSKIEEETEVDIPDVLKKKVEVKLEVKPKIAKQVEVKEKAKLKVVKPKKEALASRRKIKIVKAKK